MGPSVRVGEAIPRWIIRRSAYAFHGASTATSNMGLHTPRLHPYDDVWIAKFKPNLQHDGSAVDDVTRRSTG